MSGVWRWARQRTAGREARRGGAAPWPVRLTGVTPTGLEIVLDPLVAEDEEVFLAVRRADESWLSPWDATSPDPDAPARTFAEIVSTAERDARLGLSLPVAIRVRGQLVGLLTIGPIILGSFRSGAAGYWVSRSVAGQGIMPTALALAGDHAFTELGLHRLEVNIRPENAASLAVVRKLRFREEGLRRKLLHIDHAWRDHLSFALTVEDLDGQSLRSRLNQSSHEPLPRHTEPGAASGR